MHTKKAKINRIKDETRRKYEMDDLMEDHTDTFGNQTNENAHTNIWANIFASLLEYACENGCIDTEELENEMIDNPNLVGLDAYIVCKVCQIRPVMDYNPYDFYSTAEYIMADDSLDEDEY